MCKPDERLVVAMASNTVGRFAASALDGEREIVAAEIPVLVRDAVAGWLLEHGGHIDAADLVARAAALALPADGCADVRARATLG